MIEDKLRVVYIIDSHSVPSALQMPVELVSVSVSPTAAELQ